MNRALQWVLRTEEPIENLIWRLLSALETEGQRLLKTRTAATPVH